MIFSESILRMKQTSAVPRLRHIGFSIKIIVLLCGLLSVFTSLFPAAPTRRELRTSLDGAGEYCPFNVDQFIPPTVGPETAKAAVAFTHDIDAESLLQEALAKNAFHRRTILVGDSLTRQNFIALGCLLYKAGIIDGGIDTYIAWQSDKSEDSKGKNFNDARIKFMHNGKYNQVFFHPTAGKINEYGWGYERKSSPMEGTEDWLESCRKREPFYLDTYALQEGYTFQKFFNDQGDFERLKLGQNDVVIINAGFHPSTRRSNLEKLATLADCMNEAKSRGEGQNWPKIRYMRTSQQHFATKDGTYDSKNPLLPCQASPNGEDPYFRQDLQYIEGKLHILGKKLDLNALAHLHVGTRGKKSDCSHWALPGVPNLFVKTILKTIIAHNEYRSIM